MWGVELVMIMIMIVMVFSSLLSLDTIFSSVVSLGW